MKTSNRITHLVNELAAYWTEPALEILKHAGNSRVTVQSEIETWRTLGGALQNEVDDRRRFRSPRTLSFGAVMEKVFRQVFEVLVRQCKLPLSSRQVNERIQTLILDRQTTAAERELFQELASDPVTAFKSARQTDFAPRLQLLAVGG